MNPNNNEQRTRDDTLKKSPQQTRRTWPAAAGRSAATGERSTPPMVEQEPIMRSLAIAPASHREKSLLVEAPLRRVEPSSLAHLRPLRGISEPQLKSASEPKHRGELQHHHHGCGGRSKSLSHLGQKWHVEDSSLAIRPDDFPELSTKRVVRSAAAHEISKRLAECLRARSIKMKVSKGDGSVARCRNVDYCKFTIRLYSAGEEGGVLVEIHRLYGDCMSFMRDVRALLDASEGKKADASIDEKPLYLTLPVSGMEFAKTATLPPVTHEEQVECVDITASLLSSRCSDSNMLGMESLVIQTDPLKTLKSTAVIASGRILCPNDPGNVEFNVHNYIMSLVLYGGTTDDESGASDPSSEETVFTAMDDHNSKLRNLAMSALFNALSLYGAENLILTTLEDNQEWYNNVLIPKLLRDLGTAEHHPHDACYAVRCLSALAQCSSEFADKMKESEGLDVLDHAKDVGTNEFAMLARDAASCHNILSFGVRV